MCAIQPRLIVFLISTFLKIFYSSALCFKESTTTTLSLIENYGYPSEQHKILTADNYIITLYRIPYSPKNNMNAAKRPVIFIMHGLEQSSSDWVLSSPRGLAFFLSDAGYDVWMGNARGTRYSKAHANLSTYDPRYWNFSWHEIGIYDLPANIDYILKYTSSTQVQYIGHSQGTTSFLVATSTLPDFNDKINSAFLMAPGAFFKHAQSKILEAAAPLYGKPNPLLFGAFEFLPNCEFLQKASQTLCGDSSLVCTALSSLIYGPGSKHTNGTALAIFFETAPAGSSIKQMYHYLQLYNSKKFRQFDYGFIKNQIIYKQLNPPDYQLKNIKTPIYAYYSENDDFVAPEDVKFLLDSMEPGTVQKTYKMPFKTWNHIDFVLADNVDEVLYSIMLEHIRNAREMR